MSRRLATVLLACAALGSLAVAGLRIAGANARHLTDEDKHVRVYGTTPALAAATLASLRMPPGFRHAKCLSNEEPYWGCWSKSPSLPVDDSGMRRLVLTMGARLDPVFAASHGDEIPAVHCMRFHVDRKYHLGIQSCKAEALKGDERLGIFVKSFVLPSRKPTRRVIAEPTWVYPTEVDVIVAGHFEHEGTRPGEEG
jgi:hypothetical protein